MESEGRTKNGVRLLGALCVLGGCLGYALQYLEERKRHIGRLKEWQLLLEYLEGEIRFGKCSLPECFLHVGERLHTPLGCSFQNVGMTIHLEPDKNLRGLLEEALKKELKPLYQEEASGELLAFLPPDGFFDEQMQCRALMRCRERVEELLEEQKEAYRKKCRVAVSLGAAVGCFIILLLI